MHSNSSPPPEGRMTTVESCGYIAGLLPWRLLGAGICFAGLIGTALTALKDADFYSNIPITRGIHHLAAAVAFGWGFQTLMRRDK